ncbi:GNAT family N-acetyltransferase [Flavobacterium sp. SUN046]|uniref:GNAT family N-acetyltransferase n=1 Tax=Flavobacterium sp. SUN046 TaxID=3002440 RepID=UPI002DB678C9|nr:GNAT family N-acetyltransferase [Flavobacterium sp. SUN046]MEC4050528.1 GNAT family N-acetyltransferase [Flavobacterium sp. SUN046]
MKIEKANTEDHILLTEITKKSKAYWGYSEEQLVLWNENLTLSKNYIQNNPTYKLLKNNNIIAYYSYLLQDENVKLDNLFVLPEHIGKGYGKLLINDFLHRMKVENHNKIILDADPNSEKFYLKMGFKKIGQFESDIKNRFMPIMEIILK